MKIETLRYGDNWVYVLIESDRAAVVDPGTARPVSEFLSGRDAVLEWILITHHHGDHTAGCGTLQQATECRIAGPAGASVMLDRVVKDGDTIPFAGQSIEALAVPGHTDRDMAYYLPMQKAVFTGDTLFSCGCGRVFGSGMERMWRSLCRLRELPDDTRVYGGHDYTCENLEFAAHLEPDNAAVQDRLRRFKAAAAAGRPAEPATLAEEKQTNPFLRCDVPSFMAAMKMTGRPPAEVFAVARGRKDRW